MASAERLYYCATTLLYAAIGAWYYLFDPEDIRPPDKVAPSGPDGGDFGAIAAWVLHESYQIPEELVNDLGQEELADGHTEIFLNGIWNCTRSAHESYPQIEPWQWMYYLYYRSVVVIIEEFERLMHESPLHSSPFYESYLGGAQNLSEYKSLLAPYLPKTINESTDAAVLQIITQRAAKSARDWRSFVYASANK